MILSAGSFEYAPRLDAGLSTPEAVCNTKFSMLPARLILTTSWMRGASSSASLVNIVLRYTSLMAAPPLLSALSNLIASLKRSLKVPISEPAMLNCDAISKSPYDAVFLPQPSP